MFKKSAKKPDNPYTAHFNPNAKPGEVLTGLTQDQLQEAKEYYNGMFSQMSNQMANQNQLAAQQGYQNSWSQAFNNSLNGMTNITLGASTTTTTTATTTGQSYTYGPSYFTYGPPQQKNDDQTPTPKPKPMTEDPKFAEAIDAFLDIRAKRG